MIKKFKSIILLTITSLTLAVPTLVPALASTATADNIQSGFCTGVNNGANNTNNSDCGTAGNSTTGTNLSGVASKIVNIFSIIVGIVAVLMIIYGGFRYITSGGASDKVGSAKNTLIYAVIGLIVVALAQLIVHYVINTATTGTSGLGS